MVRGKVAELPCKAAQSNSYCKVHHVVGCNDVGPPVLGDSFLHLLDVSLLRVGCAGRCLQPLLCILVSPLQHIFLQWIFHKDNGLHNCQAVLPFSLLRGERFGICRGTCKESQCTAKKPMKVISTLQWALSGYEKHRAMDCMDLAAEDTLSCL